MRLTSRWSELVTLAAFALGLAIAAPAHAQSSGSSFGGGSFGGGSSSSWGGSSSSSSSSWGGSSSSGWGGSSSSGWGGSSSGWSSSSSSSGSSTSYVSSGSVDSVYLALLVGLLVAMVVFKAAAGSFRGGRRDWSAIDPGPTPTFVANMDVTALMVAIDARARAAIQGELDEMARSGNTATPLGRRQLLAGAVAAIERTRTAWVYVGSHDARPASPAVAERTFQQLTGDLRARFRHELVRNVDGDRAARESPDFRARAEEGEGLCVVSFVVAAKRMLADLRDVAEPNRFLRALRVLRGLSTHELVAFEVIWSPSAEDDRMSSAELEVLYPELRAIPAEPVGRVACGHCGATYARELGQCPSCGAPPPPA